MDDLVIQSLREELGDEGLKLVVQMVNSLDAATKSEVKSQIRRLIEDAADKGI